MGATVGTATKPTLLHSPTFASADLHMEVSLNIHVVICESRHNFVIPCQNSAVMICLTVEVHSDVIVSGHVPELHCAVFKRKKVK